MKKHSFLKPTVLDYLWQYSHFYGQRLYECEELFSEGKGYAATTLLFACLENVIKSVVNDYDSSFYNVVEKLKSNSIISDVEYKFVNSDEFCIRKIRNLFAHANLSAINLVNYEENRKCLYPLTEEDSCLLLYEKISLVIFNLILKIISSDFTDEVKAKLEIDLHYDISNCKLEFKTLTSKEMLILKGFPEDYIPEELGIPEDAKIRLIENEPDVNIYTHILKNLT